MLKWVETPTGAYAVLLVLGVELARLEVTSSSWRILAREGSLKEGCAGSMEFAKSACIIALEEILSTALVDVRSSQHASRSRRPPGWGG
jgi:hypothetical protein